MTAHQLTSTDPAGRRRFSPWRVAAWSIAALLLLAPAVAMLLGAEGVAWTAGDFLIATMLILAVGIPFELVVRRSVDRVYRAGVGVGLLAAFLLVWINGAVGIIGPETNDANMMYFAVLGVAIAGAVAAFGRPRGMAYAMFAAAAATAVVAAIAIAGDLGRPEDGPFQLLGVNAMFVMIWVTAGGLFLETARRREAGESGA